MRDEHAERPAERVLQNLVLPEQGICTEQALYLHLRGAAACDASRGEIWLGEGGEAGFDSYFNAFSVAKWHDAAPLGHLALQLEISGHFLLRVFHALPGRSWEMLASSRHQVPDAGRLQVDLSHFVLGAATGVIFFELVALGETLLRAGRFVTTDPPARSPRLAVCITTFRREAEVTRSAERLAAFIAASPMRTQLSGIIVDNGGTLALPPLPRITCIANRNLGGAGGFARGMMEAEARGADHCLFMDDDAALHMEAIHRALAFLSHARAPDTAITGAMISNSHKWALWEAGATFDRGCRPQQGGRDLRLRDEVLALEWQTRGAVPNGFYAGFWFFAFPLAAVRAWPFPFFVRGDDVSFSLANRFRMVRLNGVVAFQDDFTEKESVLTHYLDLRSHLVHHLVFARLAIGRWALIRLALRFVARSLYRLHYDSAAAELRAWQDVMRGPDFFATSADMAHVRAEVIGLARDEVWTSGAVPLRPSVPLTIGRLRRLWLRVSLNGHLLPFAGRAQGVVAAGARGSLAAFAGLAQVTCLRPGSGEVYHLRRSRRRGLALLARALGQGLRMAWRYPALCRDYRAAYPQLASAAFWAGQFGTEPPLRADPGVPSAPPEPAIAAEVRSFRAGQGSAR